MSISKKDEQRIAAFRREVVDKLWVVHHGANDPIRLTREVHFKQCEDFLVEMFEDALKANAETLRLLRREKDDLELTVERAWHMIENCYSMESRVELETQAATNGFGSGLAQAIFHIHKRPAK